VILVVPGLLMATISILPIIVMVFLSCGLGAAETAVEAADLKTAD